MKRRNPAFIILIFLFWYYSTIRERKKPLLQDIFHKVRVTNLTQGGQPAVAFAEIPVPERTNASLKADAMISTGSFVIGISNSISDGLLAKLLKVIDHAR